MFVYACSPHKFETFTRGRRPLRASLLWRGGNRNAMEVHGQSPLPSGLAGLPDDAFANVLLFDGPIIEGTGAGQRYNKTKEGDMVRYLSMSCSSFKLRVKALVDARIDGPYSQPLYGPMHGYRSRADQVKFGYLPNDGHTMLCDAYSKSKVRAKKHLDLIQHVRPAQRVAEAENDAEHTDAEFEASTRKLEMACTKDTCWFCKCTIWWPATGHMRDSDSARTVALARAFNRRDWKQAEWYVPDRASMYEVCAACHTKNVNEDLDRAYALAARFGGDYMDYLC